MAAALGDIARAKGMAQIASETGLGHESLYKALFPEGNPKFARCAEIRTGPRLAPARNDGPFIVFHPGYPYPQGMAGSNI